MAKQPPAPTSAKSTPKQTTAFPITIPDLFARSIRGYAANVIPLTLAAFVTFGVLGGLYYWADSSGLLGDGEGYQADAVVLAIFLVTGTVAYPWYYYAIGAASGERVPMSAPFQHIGRFAMQAVASFWFAAGVLLGQRYLLGIPALFVLLLYAFHGYVVASGRVKGGLVALGTSVRLGEKRRIALLALGGLLMIFNMFGAVGGFIDPEMAVELRWVLSAAGLLVSGSISLVVGAVLFLELWEKMSDDVVLARIGSTSGKRSGSSKSSGRKRSSRKGKRK